MAKDYSEDQLIQRSTAELLEEAGSVPNDPIILYLWT